MVRFSASLAAALVAGFAAAQATQMVTLHANVAGPGYDESDTLTVNGPFGSSSGAEARKNYVGHVTLIKQRTAPPGTLLGFEGEIGSPDGGTSLTSIDHQLDDDLVWDSPLSYVDVRFGWTATLDFATADTDLTPSGSGNTMWLSKRGYDYYQARHVGAFSYDDGFSVISGEMTDVTLSVTAHRAEWDLKKNGPVRLRAGGGKVSFQDFHRSLSNDAFFATFTGTITPYIEILTPGARLTSASGFAYAPPVPEPASMAVLGLGLAAFRKRRQRSK